MKRKFKLLSILSAVVIGATMGLTACANGGVEEHDHKWNDGEITKDATCYAEGVKTYTCTFDGCGQTKTEPVAMTAHDWDDGEVTKAPKCNEEGEKTFKCTNDGCNRTKTEPVDKTDHRWNDGEITRTPDFLIKGVKKYTCLDCDEERSESVAAHADFAEQFSTSSTEQESWLYGYANSFDKNTGYGDYDGAQADAASGKWKATGVEIGKGYVYSANHAVIVYHFSETLPAQTQTDVAITFKGEESSTVLKAYLFVIGEEGITKSKAEINGAGAKDWSYNTTDAIDIEQYDTVFLVFENAGTGKAGGELTFTLTSPCVHVWNSGSVKTPATCKAEGEMEYTCLSCDDKYTQSIEKTPHEYDEGKVTLEPTTTHPGEKTYTCTNCGDEKVETIPQLEPDTKTEIANFGGDFASTLTGESNWEVGVVNYNFDVENFAFNALTPDGEAFKNGDPWMEIKGDWMAVNGMMGFAYHFQGTAAITFNFELTNGNNEGDFAVRWALKDSNGNIKTNDGKASWGGDGHVITVTADFTVEEGDVLYVLVEKKGNSTTDQCNFSLVISAEGKTEEPAMPFEGANFGEDFELNADGEFNGWSVGVVNYEWSSETFGFTKITALNGNGDCYHSDNPWMDIKGDWMAVNGMMGFAYHFQGTASTTFKLVINGADNSVFSVRWALKDKDGNIKTNDGRASWGGDGHVITVTGDITAENGDVLYILVNKDGENDQCWFTLELSGEEQAQQPETPFEGANFGEDFELNADGEFNGWSVGVVNYEWSSETFGFTKITALNGNGDCYHSDNPWMDIKGDWMAVNGMMGFAYHFQGTASTTFKLVINGADNSVFSVRWALKDKDGNIKTNDGKASWGGDGKDLTVTGDITAENGDVLYILVNKDGENDQCNFTLNITSKETNS